MQQEQATNEIVEACLLNAERLLDAARIIRKPTYNHISYHLATLALEEIGKAALVRASSLRPAGDDGQSNDDSDDDRWTPLKWVEDHEHELFWAIWTVAFGKERISVDQFRQLQSTAKFIHELRLGSLYVDALNPQQQREVSAEELDNLLSLTDARLGMERSTKIRELDDDERSLMRWFFAACEHPQLKPIVFSSGSLAKFAEFEGDTGKWINWLRQSVEDMDRANRELAEREMRRESPTGQEKNEPKWQMKIRLKSWSHSIRRGVFKKWNAGVDWIKLYQGSDNKELVAQFIVPKRVQAQELWAQGRLMSWSFVISLNIGAFGYFWWYLPTFVSKYYEEIIDLENQAAITVTPPPLEVSWGNRALTDLDLSNVAQVFLHLTRIAPSQRTTYDYYFRALGLVAKNDIFGQLEPGILLSFYEAFREGLKAYGDWDGVDSTLEVSIDRVLDNVMKDSSLRVHMKELLQLASDVAAKREPSRPIRLDDAINMKTYCDLYLQLRARQDIKRKAEQEANEEKLSQPDASP